MDDIDSQIEMLLAKLEFLREQMPETPLDAERKAMEIGLLEEELAELYQQKGSAPKNRTSDVELDDLMKQISDITDELMQLEILMLKAEMSGNDSEKTKLQLSANALKSRRQTLIDQVREMNETPQEDEKDDLKARVEALEKEVADLKALVYRLLTR